MSIKTLIKTLKEKRRTTMTTIRPEYLLGPRPGGDPVPDDPVT